MLGRDNLRNENALTTKFKYTNTVQVTLKWKPHLKGAYSLIKVQLWSIGMKRTRRNCARSRLQGQMVKEDRISWKVARKIISGTENSIRIKWSTGE